MRRLAVLHIACLAAALAAALVAAPAGAAAGPDGYRALETWPETLAAVRENGLARAPERPATGSVPTWC